MKCSLRSQAQDCMHKCSLGSQAQDAKNHSHEASELMLILQIITWDYTLAYLHKWKLNLVVFISSSLGEYNACWAKSHNQMNKKALNLPNFSQILEEWILKYKYNVGNMFLMFLLINIAKGF